MGLISLEKTRKLYFIVGAARGVPQLVTSRRGMGIISKLFFPSSILIYANKLQIRLLNYEGSWLDWVQKEGAK